MNKNGGGAGACGGGGPGGPTDDNDDSENGSGTSNGSGNSNSDSNSLKVSEQKSCSLQTQVLFLREWREQTRAWKTLIFRILIPWLQIIMLSVAYMFCAREIYVLLKPKEEGGDS